MNKAIKKSFKRSPHMIYLGHGILELNEGGYSNMTSLFRGGPPNLTLSDKGGGGPKFLEKDLT